MIINKTSNGKIQYLTEILPEIPTNTILNKTLTGLGATYAEIKADRNSIIMEPNKPVITGKCNDPKHENDNLLGVIEGVYTDDVIDYIESSQKKNKKFKILTTPESFRKVREAFEEMDIDIRFNCFLLLDECQKYVKDVDYRGDITLPMDYFFQCENKAMVSATPVGFSDPRFKEQNFKYITIEPAFDYKKKIMLHQTNNVLQTLKELLPTLQGTTFIFCNSTDMTYNLMKQLDLFNESAVFCSHNSVNKLKQDKDTKFKNAYANWNVKNMKRINWLTSRFYNAVDMELDEAPNIILLTDCYFAKFTMFDPFTDTIQAIGRFRNGYKSIHHISNTNKNFKIQSKDEVRGYVNGLETAHHQLCVYRDTNAWQVKEAWQSIIKVSPYNQFLTEGHKDFFKIDNYIDDEVVAGYYNNYDSLEEAYKSCNQFDVSTSKHSYVLGDCERLKTNTAGNKKEKLKAIVEQLDLLGECSTEMECEYKRELMTADSFIVEAYDTVGKEVIEQFNYKTKPIKEAMILKRYNDKVTGTECIQLIKNSFKEETFYTCTHIKSELKRIFKLLDIEYVKGVTSNTIEEFFECEDKKLKKGRGKLLHKCKF